MFCIPRAAHIPVLFSIRKSSLSKSKSLTACNRALEYYDVTYRNVYGGQWPHIRVGLLTKHKYVAIVNNYTPKFEQHVQKFKEMGCIDAGKQYRANCADVEAERQQKELLKLIPTNTKRIDDGSKGAHDARPPIREMTDDERAALERKPPSPLYPEEYRQRSEQDTNYVADRPSSDRVVLPQEHFEEELQSQTLHDHVPATNLKGLEEYTDEHSVFRKFHISTKPGEGNAVTFQDSDALLRWPDMLTVLAFPRSDTSRFPKPDMEHGLYDHFAMCGSSLLPVLLLGMEPGDSVLDMCAAPGGKSLAMLQTCYPGLLQSNDQSRARVQRVKSVIKQFYPTDCPLLAKHAITQTDGTELRVGQGSFDRVLVDAPCLTDRHTLQEPDNNIFSKTRLKERQQLPEVQANLIVSALKMVRVGGTVVYSTCTLSPLQNDGAVHLALNRLWDHTSVKCSVINYSKALKPFDFMFKFGSEDLGMKYGQVILPWLPNNYGPMYCAKFVRTH